MRPPKAVILAIMLAALGPSAPAQAFSTYRGGNQQAPAAIAAFQAAAGPRLELEDFEGVPTNPCNLAAFSNGDRFGPVVLASLSLTGDVSLTFGDVASGLFGTFLVAPRAPAGTLDVRPGSGGDLGTPEDDDDFRLSFPVPVAAVGILVIGNVQESGELIRVFSGGNEITSETLVGGGNDGEGFWGIVLDPGEAPIPALEVPEGGALNDDISFDTLQFAPIPATPLAGRRRLLLAGAALALLWRARGRLPASG